MKLSNTFFKPLFACALVASAITVAASAQDECASAVTVTAGVPTAFNTTTATPSGDIPTDALCAGTYLNWTVTTNDVWMKFTATGPGTLEFTTCDAASYDTSMALYRGSCTNLVACNGDGVGQGGCQPYYSRIANVVCAAGDLFYCRIGGYNGETGAGTLVVNFTAGSAACAGATGACNVVHAGFGCNNLVCCGAICEFNPLCCEVGWDQTCVDLAIEQCGYYSCPAVAGAPANNCATSPTTIPSSSSVQSFNTNGATMDGPNQTTCASGNDTFFHDVWWKVVPLANGAMKVSTCGTTGYDNKLAVYNLGATPASFDYNALSAALVVCNDDGASGTCFLTDGITNYASELTANVSLGNTYLIRMGSYTNGETGTGQIAFTLPTACAIGSGTAYEQEGCGGATNDGCNAAGQFEGIPIGATVAGTFWADANLRDTDFYRFTVTASSQVTVSVKAARNATVLILSGDLTVAACAGITVRATGVGSCPNVATACLNPGTYYAFVADAATTGNPCGSGAFNNYTMALSAVSAACPVTVSGGYNGTSTDPGVCSAPGPNSMSLNTDPNTVTSGLVACAVNPAAPNCSGGGTTANSYARVFPAGQVSGNVSCINFGAYSTVRGLSGAACATFISNIPLPATIGIYADLDGGTPRFKTINDGVDGGDLKVLYSQEVLIPGGVYRATLNLAQPFCVSAFTSKNLVVIMDCPDLNAGAQGVPGASGYGIRAGGNAAGPGSNTWCRLSCADAAAQYVLTESLGASFTAQWVCQLNGTNSINCNAPACPGDLNSDNIRNGLDLTVILSNWGSSGGDCNGDGTTNGLDLTVLLSGWGACP